MFDYRAIKAQDEVVFKLIQAEISRQNEGLELIPSENYVSTAVLQALATVYTNKYAEGYPGKRYYGGQINTDKLENLAIKRSKHLFGSDHANVQAYSGAPANLAVFHAWCEPGDTILAMDLSHGGHLTHGAPATVPAKIFNFVRYGMSNLETGEIDFNQLSELAKKYRPKIILVGHSSYPRDLDWQAFAKIAKEAKAVAVADIAHLAGLIAGGVVTNPLKQGFQVATSTTHKTLRGPRSGLILSNGVVSNPLKLAEKKIENLPTLIDRAIFPGLQGGPHQNVIAAVAVALQEAAQPEFKTYARQILASAQALASELMQQGCKLITNGTDNHLMVIDMLTSFGISGGEAETALDQVGLTVNKNVIPNDTRPAYDPSGIRLGTPAITTRGLRESDMSQVATWIVQTIKGRKNPKKIQSVAAEVKQFCKQFPIDG
jgi:glycine hydroxymethyltransferase